MRVRVLFAILALVGVTATATAQTTEFTYQGRLNMGSSPANGNYDLEFRLFDLISGGTQQGTTLQRLNAVVADGVFKVGLDFGGQFTGAPRFLDISVRQAGGGAFTPLSPRHPMTSTPYAVRSLTSIRADGLSLACVNCVTGGQIQSVNGSTVTGQIPVAGMPAGSGHYIQNTISQQSGDFNINGNGTLGGTLTASIVNATTQYNLGINRALALGTASVFAGRLAGASNTTGSGNTFVGDSSGRFNVSTSNNSFFGRDSGALNVANDNSFFGAFAGDSNTTGTRNSFFGLSAGETSTQGSDNVFVGANSGLVRTDMVSTSNTLVGSNTKVGHPGLPTGAQVSYATAVGAGAVVDGSNTIVLGRANGSDLVRIPGDVFAQSARFVEYATNGSTDVCRDAGGALSTCSSSVRYKSEVSDFIRGLDVVRKLQPIRFIWNSSGLRDVGFAAEEVADVEPLLATYNDSGQIEGVKYKQITTVLVNAVKEQQETIESLQRQIDALKKIACSKNTNVDVCKE